MTLKEISCHKCNDLGFYKVDVEPGHPHFGKVFRCDDPSHNPERLARLQRISGLDQDDLKLRLSQIGRTADNGEMIDACQAMIAEPKGWLYLWGGPGNAKTVALKALVNEINQSDQGPAMYIRFTDLVTLMTASFGAQKRLADDPFGDLSYIERFNEVKSIKFLAIDELDKQRSTEFADQFRFDFLDDRYDQACKKQTVTVFASNADPDTLPLAINDRIRDGKFKVVHNRQSSARPAMKWSE